MSDEPEKNPVGRPSKYDPKFCQMLISHMSQGLSFESFGGTANVGWRTLYEWAKEHDDFKKAKEVGEGKAMQLFEKVMISHTIGKSVEGLDLKKSNVTMAIFAMKTRFHKVYGDRMKHELEDDDDIEFV